MTHDRRPNLLFVFADQLGASRLGYGGDSAARTPVLDRFARQGVCFRQCVSNMPVCAAFRASLFTGTYTTTHGMVINELRLHPNQRCLGHVLGEAGYESAYVGKWHLFANELGHHFEPRNSFVPRGPHRLGFDGFWAAYNFHHLNFKGYYHTESAEKRFYGDGVYEPDAQTEILCGWLRQPERQQRPFAAFLSWGAPHDPWEDDNVPETWRRRFDPADFPHPPNDRETPDPYADRGWHLLSAAERDRLPLWRRNYAAMTANLDWNFGRLLEALERSGLAANTIVVFTSDHGEMFGAHGRRAKNIFYEEAARVPCLLRWPDHAPAGLVSDACLSSVDLMPTLLGLLGLPIPAAVEGADLSHCALGRPGPEPEMALLQNTGAVAKWEDGYEWRALRDSRWTYAVYRVDGRELLFDRVADPWQRDDLAGKAMYRETLLRFRAALARRLGELRDGFEASSYYRDNWTDGNRCIVGSASRDFGPPVPPEPV
ncbi:MAG: sulfatase [Lentisphaeria bacterium]|nr:sulfatase [Lentisphaeria bacterium]